MDDSEFDFVIVGQGLAGTALGWQLHKRGLRVLLVDRDRGGGSSRIAAGLITPVTGKRLAKSWRLDEVYPAAVAFYRWVEQQTGTSFFSQKPSVRIFQNESEREEFFKRESGVLIGLVRTPNSPISSEWFAAPWGGFEMPTAARLDVEHYLASSRAYFNSRQQYVAANIDPSGDIDRSFQRIRISSLGYTTRAVILCRGFDSTPDPWFGGVRFNAAKGEILTLHIAGLSEDRIVHRGVWLAPLGNEIFRAGSTYVWDDLNSEPTQAGREEIERRLLAFLRHPFEVLDHRAAVRPVIDAGYPAIGLHPQDSRLAYFNGLGSKGSLLAPFFAEQLVGCLLGERQPDRAVDVRRFLGTERWVN